MCHCPILKTYCYPSAVISTYARDFTISESHTLLLAQPDILYTSFIYICLDRHFDTDAIGNTNFDTSSNIHTTEGDLS